MNMKAVLKRRKSEVD